MNKIQKVCFFFIEISRHLKKELNIPYCLRVQGKGWKLLIKNVCWKLFRNWKVQKIKLPAEFFHRTMSLGTPEYFVNS